MTCVYHEKAKNGWRLESFIRGVRRKLWLGPISKHQAQTIRLHIHSLVLAVETGTKPDPATAAWVKAVGKRIHDKLVQWGLAEPRIAAASYQLRDWCDYVLAMDQFQNWAKNTRYSMEKVADLMVTVIGNKRIDTITEADAEKVGEKLYSESASESHPGKQIKRCRQFFNVAIKSRVLDRNPFHSVRASTAINEGRKAYVTPDASKTILDNCPDQLWRVIFSLARYCGLRVPSEILPLTWDCVDWDKHRLRVVSPKQKRHKAKHERIIPIPQTVYVELRALWEQPDTAKWICNRYRSQSTAQFRKPLLGAIARAGLSQWPKLWVNLRASARTDWLQDFEPHVVNEWMGHEAKVGSKHYDRVTDADWKRAIAPTYAPTDSANQEDSQGKN